jgi:hypothetical protein
LTRKPMVSLVRFQKCRSEGALRSILQLYKKRSSFMEPIQYHQVKQTI